jgi:hypothetical protein
MDRSHPFLQCPAARDAILSVDDEGGAGPHAANGVALVRWARTLRRSPRETTGRRFLGLAEVVATFDDIVREICQSAVG